MCVCVLYKYLHACDVVFYLHTSLQTDLPTHLGVFVPLSDESSDVAQHLVRVGLQVVRRFNGDNSIAVVGDLSGNE